MKRNNWTLMLQCAKLVKPLIFYMILAICMGIVGHLFATMISVLGASLLFHTSQFLIVLLFVFALFRGVLRYIEQSFNHYIAFKLLASIRDQVFSKLRLLCPAKLEGRNKGDLIALITSDVELMEVFYAHTISPIFIAIGYSLIMVVSFYMMEPVLGLYAFLSYVLIGIGVPIWISKVSKNLGMQFRMKQGDLSSEVLETLRGMDTILQYNQQEERLNHLQKNTDDLLSIEQKMKQRIGFNNGITNTLIFLMDIGFVYISLHLSFEASVLSTIAFMSSFGPVVALAQLGTTLQSTMASAHRIFNLLEEKPIVHEVRNGIDKSFDTYFMQDVSFQYDKEMILSKFNLTIPNNTIFGIQGKSGSGKSTLLRLLMRFWDVTEGEIDLNNTNIKTINTSCLRNNESFVMQDTHLFHDSIKNNIKIAKLDATDEEIIEAAKKANIHAMIQSLPNQYETMVSELGESLSAGEKQRIGLARAFLKDAKCMLLDEPTSNLDRLNEAIILNSIYKERMDKTILLVSHRDSTLKIADTIFNLEQGRIS